MCNDAVAAAADDADDGIYTCIYRIFYSSVFIIQRSVTSNLKRPEYPSKTLHVLQLVHGQQELLKVQALPTLYDSHQVCFWTATIPLTHLLTKPISEKTAGFRHYVMRQSLHLSHASIWSACWLGFAHHVLNRCV